GNALTPSGYPKAESFWYLGNKRLLVSNTRIALPQHSAVRVLPAPTHGGIQEGASFNLYSYRPEADLPGCPTAFSTRAKRAVNWADICSRAAACWRTCKTRRSRVASTRGCRPNSNLLILSVPTLARFSTVARDSPNCVRRSR